MKIWLAYESWDGGSLIDLYYNLEDALSAIWEENKKDNYKNATEIGGIELSKHKEMFLNFELMEDGNWETGWLEKEDYIHEWENCIEKYTAYFDGLTYTAELFEVK